MLAFASANKRSCGSRWRALASDDLRARRLRVGRRLPTRRNAQRSGSTRVSARARPQRKRRTGRAARSRCGQSISVAALSDAESNVCPASGGALDGPPSAWMSFAAVAIVVSSDLVDSTGTSGRDPICPRAWRVREVWATHAPRSSGLSWQPSVESGQRPRKSFSTSLPPL